MILCDTSVLVEALRQNQVVTDHLNEIGFSNIGLSLITVMEIYQGARSRTELNHLEKWLSWFDWYPVTPMISNQACKWVKKYILSKHIQIPDALIAATAVMNDLPLYTFNLKDFSYIPGIRLYIG